MSYSVEYLDKYVKVIDRRTNEIVASGKVIFTKNKVENNGISFDDKWFFRETDHLKFEVVEFVETKLCTEPEKFDLTWEMLGHGQNQVDMLRDFGYDELDPEIAEYIYKLNEISETIKTTTSCCGHGIKPWYIEFEFGEFWDMSKFINVVETFKGDLILSTNPTTSTLIHKKKIHLVLEPKELDSDFKLLKKFCNKLQIIMY